MREEEIQAFMRNHPTAGYHVTRIINAYRELAEDSIKRCGELGEDTADWSISLAKKEGALQQMGISILRTPRDWHTLSYPEGDEASETEDIARGTEHPLSGPLHRIAMALEVGNQFNREWIQRQDGWREADVSAYEARQAQDAAYLKVIEHRHQHESLLFGLARANHAILLTRCQGFIIKYQEIGPPSEYEAVTQVLKDIESALSQFQLMELLEKANDPKVSSL